MISFRREGIVLNDLVLWRIVGPGLIAAMIAPLVYLVWYFIPGESSRGDRFGGLS